MTDGWKNKLYFGDNLPILREYIPDESVEAKRKGVHVELHLQESARDPKEEQWRNP
ncbi:MAG: hypothetical protein WAW99_05670 [Candidatus Bipolaricaulis anaerobius]|jgi:hypothetical protein